MNGIFFRDEGLSFEVVNEVKYVIKNDAVYRVIDYTNGFIAVERAEEISGMPIAEFLSARELVTNLRSHLVSPTENAETGLRNAGLEAN